jgi:hypothetical protein
MLIAGFLLKVSILWTIGIIVLRVGVVLAVMGVAGRAMGGRRHHFQQPIHRCYGRFPTRVGFDFRKLH